MPKIIPIRELRDTNAISEMCHSSGEPVFITKNGYGDMVIMSLETFEKNSGMYFSPPISRTSAAVFFALHNRQDTN